MTTGVKVFYKGEDSDFVVFATSEEAVMKYRESPSISKLSDVVDSFHIYTNRGGKGAEGKFGQASHSQIENEFGKSKKIEEAIDHILRNGRINGNDKAISSDNYVPY